ncbi:uncharacterized protein I206_104255 [Kwoniella pini CBS 10737]|uniref:Uncharacterized protein n=1 Tax=Kwoniella pini CBS 10737 TaxID=1296096 RepID=A0A1B9I298_9TREE|nr:uncharacterized protein I206_04169 [Kwoniella pini CBS 10737]OCF49647.1 hypothetical protein I206_04169 [Kwoniella pini CBS 10737]
MFVQGEFTTLDEGATERTTKYYVPLDNSKSTIESIKGDRRKLLIATTAGTVFKDVYDHVYGRLPPGLIRANTNENYIPKPLGTNDARIKITVVSTENGPNKYIVTNMEQNATLQSAEPLLPDEFLYENSEFPSNSATAFKAWWDRYGKATHILSPTGSNAINSDCMTGVTKSSNGTQGSVPKPVFQDPSVKLAEKDEDTESVVTTDAASKPAATQVTDWDTDSDTDMFEPGSSTPPDDDGFEVL